MKTMSRLCAWSLFSAMLLLLSCPAETRRGAYVSDEDLQNGRIGASPRQALVIYAAGDVMVTGAAGRIPAAVGDLLSAGQTLKTGVRAFCELQFGDRAGIRVEENTEVSLDDVFLKTGEMNIGLKASAGTILCRVTKLAGTERFKVKTPTASCGVRGTEFSVSVSADRDTLVAVRQGKVAVRPASLDTDELAGGRVSDDPELGAALADLDQAEKIVLYDHAVTVTAAAEQAAAESVKPLTLAIRARVGGQGLSAAEREELKVLAQKVKAEFEKKASVPRPQNPDEAGVLKRIDGLRQRLFKRPPEGGTAEGAEKYSRVTLEARPADAEIFLGDQFMGLGKFQGLFRQGDKLVFHVAKAGYLTKSREVEAGRESQGNIVVELEEPAAPEITPDGPAGTSAIETRDSRGKKIFVKLGEQKTLLRDGDLGLGFFPNSNVALLSRKPFQLLVAAWGETYLLHGEGLERLQKSEMVLGRGGPGSIDNASAFVSGIYRSKDGKIYMFYQARDREGMGSDPNSAYGQIAAAVSDDGGRNWQKQGAVVVSAKDKEWKAFEGVVGGGISAFGVAPEKSGRYLYIYYTEESRVDARGVQICLARADLRSGPPLPGAWKKYHNGAFIEEGLGGLETPVMSTADMNSGEAIFPQVYYAKTFGQYIMVFCNNVWKEWVEKTGLDKSGIYVSYSRDGIHWSKPDRLIKDFTVPMERQTVSWLPSIILDAQSDTAGWLVYAYSENFGGRDQGLVPYYMVGRRIEFMTE